MYVTDNMDGFGDIPKGPAGDNKVDPELQQFIQMETQKAQIQGQVIHTVFSKYS